MKITKLLFALLALSISTASFANSDPDYPTVGEEIKALIQEANIDFKDTDRVLINFLINSENKLILISANDKDNEEKLRSLLDLKNVNWSGEADINTIYTLPIIVKND
jgi:hypothetical protein